MGVASRTTVKIDIQPPIIGVGDHAEKRESIHLAALSALYQLHELDLVRKFQITRNMQSNRKSCFLQARKCKTFETPTTPNRNYPLRWLRSEL